MDVTQAQEEMEMEKVEVARALMVLIVQTGVTTLWFLALAGVIVLAQRHVRLDLGSPRRALRRAVMRSRWQSVARSSGLAVTRDKRTVTRGGGAGLDLITALSSPIDQKRPGGAGGLQVQQVAVERVPRISHGHASPDRRTITYELRSARGGTIEDVADKAEALADGLGAHRVAIRRTGPDRGELTAYLEPVFHKAVPWRPVALPDAVAWGEDEFGEMTVFPLGRGHMLVAAETEGGKSNLLNALIGSLAIRPDVALFGVDMKLVELSPWADRFTAIATTADAGQALLEAAAVEVRQRYERMAEHGIKKLVMADPRVGPWAVVVVDELSEFLADADLAALVSVARLGRGCGVHLVCATQNPNAKTLSSELRDQLVWRWCGRMSSRTTAAMVLGDGYEVDPRSIRIDQRGVGVVVDHLGPPRLARSWRMTDEQVTAVARDTAALRIPLRWQETSAAA